MKPCTIIHNEPNQPLVNQIFDSDNQINDCGQYQIYAYNQALYIINSEAGKKFKAVVQPTKICSLLQNFQDLETLIMQSMTQFKDNILTCTFDFCDNKKKIKIEFKPIQFNLQEQNKLMKKKIKDLMQDLTQNLQIKIMMDHRLDELLQFKRRVTNNYQIWQQTHCGVCGKQVKTFAKKVKGAMTCSEICSTTIIASSKWKSIFDIGI